MNKFEQKKKECTDPVMLEALDIAAKQYVDKWPKEGDKYYYINTKGNIHYNNCHNYLSYYDYSKDQFRIDVGNIFRTKEEAEKHVKYLKARTKVLNAIAKHRGDWRPDWSYRFNDKYSFTYCHKDEAVDWMAWSLQCMGDEHYFPLEAYDAIRSELDNKTIKTYLGVE